MGFKSNDCGDFIHHRDVPNDRKVIYAKFMCDCQHLKSDQYRIHLVVVGDKLYYALNSGSTADSMLETKQGDQFMSCDLKKIFLCTTMDTSEYMLFPYN